MHIQKHLHKKHPGARRKTPLITHKLRRLCAKSILCTSAFTVTLLVSSEWTIQKPLPGYWKHHLSRPAALFADTPHPAATPSRQSNKSPKTGQACGPAKQDVADSNTSGANTSDSQQTQDAAGSKKASPDAADSHAGTMPSGNTSKNNPPTYAEYDKEKPQQAPGTDEQTLYAAAPDTDIYYSYEDNQLQFSSNAGQLIQAVPERQPEEQRIDTATDDEDTAHYQQLSSNWNLILVNPWNEIPDDYEIQLMGLPNGHSIDSRCYPALTEMLAACREAGLHPLICSSYRSNEKQKSLFQERIDELTAQGYSKKEARQKAATSVARPGTSEHQAGLAVDIVDSSHQLLDATQEQTPVQQWLMENSWKYGFILRYPLDKSSLTGIIYEPWHYRYVGTKAAQEIYEQGICLEEYLEGLS